MNLTDILAQTGGLQSVARDLGVSEEQAATGVGALLPAILGGMKKQAQAQPADAGGLGGSLAGMGGSGLFDQVLSPQPTDPSPGNEVLGQIFGSKDVSRTVAEHAATQSGLDSSLLRKMLPLAAMLVTGFIAKQAGGATETSGGGLGALVGSVAGMFGAGAGSADTSSGLGRLTAMLDTNGDGNALDDIMRMTGKSAG
jgi:hypothetical protein